MSSKTTTASGAGSIAIGGPVSGNTITTHVTVVQSGGSPPGPRPPPTDDEPFPTIDPPVDVALRICVRSETWFFDARIGEDPVATETVPMPAAGKRRLLPSGRPRGAGLPGAWRVDFTEGGSRSLSDGDWERLCHALDSNRSRKEH